MSIDADTKRAIEQAAGGAQNITFSHATDEAMTLSVKDQGLVDRRALEKVEGVAACELSNGMLTVSIAQDQEEKMASKHHDFAGQVLDNVGGIDNVVSLTHCITRLRFKLKDESKADKDALMASDGVITVMQAGGQYQVVVGDKVDDVYDTLLSEYHVKGAGEVDADDAAPADDEGGNLFDKLMGTISGTMAPLLMGLAAAGMIKGLVAMAAAMGWITTTSGTYQVWYAIGDGFFYFLPIILGYTASKKFGCSEFTGMAIGAALVYPTMVNIANPAVIDATATTVAEAVSVPQALGSIFAGTPFEMSYYSTFLGIPIVMPAAGYTSSVIPIILAVWVASKLEKWLKTVVPSVVRNFLVPVICFAVMAPLTYLLIGPIAGIISGVLTLIAETIYNIPVIGAPLSGLVIGGGWSTLVMFGLHWAIVPVFLNNFSTLGFDYVSAVTFLGGFIAVGQGIAFLLRSKNEKMKGVAIPATISQFCGVGEPFLYGVQIPSKILFVQDVVLSAIGGLIMGILGVKIYMSGGMGFFAFPSYINPATGDMSDMIKCIVVTAVMTVAGFVLTMLTYSDEKAGFATGEKVEAVSRDEAKAQIAGAAASAK